MIIDLTKSTLFTIDPDIRFAKEYHLPKGIWTELWRRYKLLGYNHSELAEYLQIKTGKKHRNRNIQRWILRTEIYSKVSPLMKKGATHANTDIFGNLEYIVLNEFTRHLRNNGTGTSRIII